MSKNTAVLKNAHYYFFNPCCLSGCIYQDSGNRFTDGLRIRTSAVIRLFVENGILHAETRNSIYQIEGDIINEF